MTSQKKALLGPCKQNDQILPRLVVYMEYVSIRLAVKTSLVLVGVYFGHLTELLLNCLVSSTFQPPVTTPTPTHLPEYRRAYLPERKFPYNCEDK